MRRSRLRSLAALCSSFALLVGCGSRTRLSEGFDGSVEPPADAGVVHPDVGPLDAGRDAGPPRPRCVASPALAAFQAAINPTGDAIGGGPGYGNLVAPSAVDARVSSAEALERALATLGPGATIYVEDDAEIDLSGRSITLPEGVTLASGRGRGDSRGALLFQRSLDGPPMLVTGGPGVRVTGLRLRGPDPTRGDRIDRSVAYGVDFAHEGELDDCELWAWPGAAVRVRASGVFVHHSDFHHQRRPGVAASVRIEADGPTRVEACRFDRSRHHLEATHAGARWEAAHLHVLPHGADPRFISQSEAGRSAGGVLRGSLLEGDADFDLAIGGDPTGPVRYEGNWTEQEDLMDAVRLDTDAARAAFVARDNELGARLEGLLPRAIAVATPIEAVAPVEVAFDGSASALDLGGDCALRSYAWHFGDGEVAEPPVYGARVQHRYDTPGRYLATLTVDDESGISGRAHVPVLVRPARDGRWLSVWLRDSHADTQPGYYAIELRVDDRVVYRRDVAEQGRAWEHVLLDVTDATAPTGVVEITVRLTALRGVTDRETEINDVFVWIDDLYLFGGGVVNGDYEDGANGWVFEEVGSVEYLSGSTLSDARSGERSLVLGVGYVEPRAGRGGPSGGSFVQTYQRFMLTP